MNSAHSLRLLAAMLVALATTASATADEQPSKAPGRQAGAASAKKIDLNTADVKSLEAVPDIGPELARQIVAARPFATVDELNRVQGISAERLEQIRAKATVAQTVGKNRLGEPTGEPSVKSGLGTPSTAQPPAKPRGKKVDVNMADLKTLEAIPAIGPEAARAIVAARPFNSIDDLSRVQGISAEQLEQLRSELAVGTAETGPGKKSKARTNR